MKKYALLVLFLTGAAQVFCQNKDFDIFILFDSNHKGMYSTYKKVNDSISYKLFSIEKLVPKEVFTKSIFIDDSGNLREGIIGATSHNKECCKIDLINISLKKSPQKILKIETRNVLLDYETIKNIKFSNFNDIINKAKNIYIVTSDNTNAMYYNKYKVKLSI